MDEVQKYWRDKVMGLFQWSLTLYLLLAGWSITYHDKFELCADSTKSIADNRDNFIRAVSFISMSLMYGIALPLLVRHIYQKFLPKEKIDATVLPYRVALTTSMVLAFLIFLLAFLTSYFYGCA
ncbi:MAG: hypothetical protein AUG51_23095 [Acidobacteria bacterium 13_1_20CM_3_53_8]|nr:MAG: hypothetical protein AUG51_23095 [Acidobacteria bacterium 13_1_20CM_3_53_8]